MKPNEITASRLKQLRESKNLSQEDFGREFAEFTNRKQGAYSVMSVSCWETGRKLPPADTIISLAQFYGCTSDYILGLSANAQMLRVDEKVMQINHKIEIPINDLAKFDKQAVYVQFPNGSMSNCWGIIDYASSQIQLNGMRMQITPKCQYFRFVPPEALTIRDRMSRLIGPDEIRKLDVVYIQSISPDPYIQGMVSGWYHKDVSGEFLINNEGRALSYEGLGIAYNALDFDPTSTKSSTKKTTASAKTAKAPAKTAAKAPAKAKKRTTK